MKKHLSLSGSLLASAAMAAMLFAMGCTPSVPIPPPVVNPDFAIAPPEYSALAEKALAHLSKFEYDAWSEMLADNVEYYFPDGDVDTRTKLVGKQVVLAWWKNWQKTSGIQSMTFSLPNHIPVEAIKAPNMTGLPGIYVFSFLSNKMVFKGNTVALRMNFSVHFNQDKKIDRYYTYYDRAPIIEAMGGQNLLKAAPATK